MARKTPIGYNGAMSTSHTPFAFYGRYFTSRAAAEAFLTDHGTDFDSDGVCGETSDTLGLQYLREDVYILGFALQPGESDSAAKTLWRERIDASESEAQSYFEIFTY